MSHRLDVTPRAVKRAVSSMSDRLLVNAMVHIALPSSASSTHNELTKPALPDALTADEQGCSIPAPLHMGDSGYRTAEKSTGRQDT